MRFFCRVTAGLEDIVTFDLMERLKTIHIDQVKWRQIDFCLDENLPLVKTLPTVDDVYLFVSELKDVLHTRSELERIGKFARQVKFTDLLEQLEQFRPIPSRKSFYVTVSRIGKHNYSSTEIQSLFEEEIRAVTGWEPVQNFHEAQLNFRVIIEHGTFLVGLSITRRPLHKREYKTCHLPGSLKPPVAHLISRIIGCRGEDILLDPMCGVGTTLIEARLANPGLTAFGSDQAVLSVKCARENWRNAFLKDNENLFAADIYAYPLDGNFCYKIYQ